MTRREELYVAWLPAGTSGTAACWHATWSNPIAVTADGGKDSAVEQNSKRIVSIQQLGFWAPVGSRGRVTKSGVDFVCNLL